MSIALVLLAGAAVTPLTGDFDGDGLADRAYVHEANNTHELVVERGAGGTAVVQAVTPLHLYLGVLEPGSYQTACAKGLGPRTAPCPERALALARPTLQFGTEEASQAAAVWDGARFRVVWLSD
jgi:hypothetical protein